MTLPTTPITQPAVPRGPVLALDLGGTHLRTAVVDVDGGLHGRQHARTPLDGGAEAVVTAAIASLQRSRDAFDAIDGAAPVGIGISAPGPLDPSRGILIDPPNLPRDFWDLPLGPRLGTAFGLPWALERDTQVAVLAEWAFGAGRGLTDLVYLTISTGVGGAIVSSGRLITGPDEVAGELGHLTIDMNGLICSCGGRGHLERMASGSGMARSAREAVEAGEDAPQLARIAARIAPAPLDGRHVSEGAEAGDPVAARIVNDARRAFAASVVSIVDVFNPQRVIVGGGITMAWGDTLLQPARDLVAATAFRVQARRAEIVPASLGDDVGLIGALPLVAARLAANEQPPVTPVGRTSARPPVPAATG